MTSSAPGVVLPMVVGLLAGALVTVCAWISVELVEPPPASSHELAGRFGVDVVYVPDLVCSGIPADGCYRRSTPGVIYLRPGLAEHERDVVLHELGHVMQDRAGVPGDECGADRIAAELGAQWFGYAC
ncbi:MAG TPA: hypothetical protein VNQ48_00160 [Microbacteriaceae bacterium]|nr:hypothetical protein [Microbacteriaceae bacterium]